MWADVLVAVGMLAMFGMGFWTGHAADRPPAPPRAEPRTEGDWLGWSDDLWWHEERHR